MEFMNYIWPGLAVWLAWLWVAIWQWILAKKAMQVMWKKPELNSFFLTITILWMALVESAVIYWLIVAFQILWNDSISLLWSIWAWLAIWLTWLWAWVWEWKLVAWALWAIDKNPESKAKLMTFMVLFIALVESAAIYWLVVAFKILWADEPNMASFAWMWMAVWFAWLWVAIWEWIIAEKAMSLLWKKSKLTNFFLTVTILWIALVESAAIYWLIVSFDIFNNSVWLYASLWAWLAIWLAWLWAWVWEWLLVKWALRAIDKNPEAKSKIMTFMVLFIALVESAAIYWLVIAFKILWSDDPSITLFIWMWMAVWFAWLWVAIWEWIIAEKSMSFLWKKSKLTSFFLTVTILWIALVESAAIYWLVISFDIFSKWVWLYASLWAWLAIWLAWLWAWVWEWMLIKWALWAINKNPELKWKIITFMVLFVALVEVTAIYGLIVAFKILSDWWADNMAFVWAWLAIWLAWLWVAIWRWYLSEDSLEVMWKNPKMLSYLLTVSVLWVALVESAAIYALIVSFQILWTENVWGYASIWAWLAIWLAWLWAWIWEWKLVAWSLKSISNNPKIKWKIMTLMVLFVALVESAAIYWLVVAFKILWTDDPNIASFVWMWMAVWFAWLWVAIWEWILSKRAMESISKRPEMLSFFLTVTILWIALVESAAIYWLVVAFDLLNKEIALYASIWAWLAIWLAWLWAWIWEWMLVSGSISSIERNPKIKWKIMTFMVLFIALIEVTAIYWFIIAFKTIDIVRVDSVVDSMLYIWAWLSIWLAWLWVAIWRWYLSQESIEIMWKNPKVISFLLTVSILWVALVESAAIYALVVSFEILWVENIFATLWAWLAIWLAWLWVWVWEWLLIKWAMEWINKAPESKWKTLAFMVLFVALVEVVAIYWLIIAFKVLW